MKGCRWDKEKMMEEQLTEKGKFSQRKTKVTRCGSNLWYEVEGELRDNIREEEGHQSGFVPVFM